MFSVLGAYATGKAGPPGPPGADGDDGAPGATGPAGPGRVVAALASSTNNATAAAETLLAPHPTIPAGTLKAGSILKATFAGRYTQAMGQLTPRIYLQTSVLLDFGPVTVPAAATSRGWVCELTLVIGAEGAAGDCRAMAVFYANNGATFVVTTNASLPFNTTVDRDLKMTMQWASADAGNAILASLTTAEHFG